jgi:predicted molibdopterin-dependent oxidoreductase YjgC
MLTRPDNDTLPNSGSLPKSDTLTVYFAGRAIAARAGDSIAAALLADGITVTRHTPVSGAARGPYCMMGACFDCLAVVDGRPSVQTCMTEVRDGMRIDRQDGARGLAIEP